MDTLKKFLGLDTKEKDANGERRFGDEFRKPVFFDDSESDDELYNSNEIFKFQIFTNPLEMQKHFEQQMQSLLKTMDEYEGDSMVFDENVREKYLKPGFEEQLKKEMGDINKRLDTDLDNEIYADQLHSLLQRVAPEIHSLFPDIESNQPMRQQQRAVANENGSFIKSIKRTDLEKIWDRIHGTDIETTTDNKNNHLARKKKLLPIPKYSQQRSAGGGGGGGGSAGGVGGVFEGVFQGPKIFRQSIVTKTIRKPDGTYETKKTVRDVDGKTTTTLTRTREGKTETFVYDNDNKMLIDRPLLGSDRMAATSGDEGKLFIDCDRNIVVTNAGYALPRNIW